MAQIDGLPVPEVTRSADADAESQGHARWRRGRWRRWARYRGHLTRDDGALEILDAPHVRVARWDHDCAFGPSRQQLRSIDFLAQVPQRALGRAYRPRLDRRRGGDLCDEPRCFVTQLAAFERSGQKSELAEVLREPPLGLDRRDARAETFARILRSSRIADSPPAVGRKESVERAAKSDFARGQLLSQCAQLPIDGFG